MVHVSIMFYKWKSEKFSLDLFEDSFRSLTPYIKSSKAHKIDLLKYAIQINWPYFALGPTFNVPPSSTWTWCWQHHTAVMVFCCCFFFSKDTGPGYSWWEVGRINPDRNLVANYLRLRWMLTFQQEDDSWHIVRATMEYSTIGKCKV